MKWPQVIEQYVLDYQSRGRSPHTVALVRTCLRYLVEFCRQHQLAPHDVTESHIAALQQALRWQPGREGRLLSESHVARTLEVVRGFFRWAARKQLLLTDPTHNLLVRRVIPIYRILTVAEVQTMLATPAADTVLGMRDGAVLELLYETGLRRRECYLLDLEDVDFARDEVRVRHGKGGHGRILPLGDRLAETLTRYLEKSRPRLCPRLGEKALFLSRDGLRLKYHSIHRLVAQAGREAGVKQPVGPHDLRHAMASHMLAAGADVRAVQQLLGHVSILSTQIYTHLQPVELFEEHRRTHPRAQLQDGPDVPLGGE